MRFFSFLISAFLFTTAATASHVVSFISQSTGDLLLESAEASVRANGRYQEYNPSFKGLDREKGLLYFTLDDGTICSIAARVTDSKGKTYVSLEMIADIDMGSNQMLEIRYNLSCL